MPYQVMQEGPFDIGVIGEAEETILELARHIEEKGAEGLGHIRGIIFREGGRVIINPRRGFIEDLDQLPFPARHLLPHLSRYSPTPASYRRLPLGIMITSRGCPQQCTFCDRSVFGNAYRQRSTNNVLAEAEELINKHGAKEIRFFDDCFTLDKERAYNLCSGLKKLKVPWTCLTTVNSVTKELLQEMRAAGCWQVLFGLESGDEKMLRILRKGATLKQNINAVRWAKDSGLSVRADFIIGTPAETEESLKKTLDFTLKMDLDYAHFNKFVPYPGTTIYHDLINNGYNFDFKHGSSITDNTSFLYIPQGMKRVGYYKSFINYAHRRFYLRLGYILKRLFSIMTLEEFKGQIKGFFSIAFLKT
jgi:anaerobic magnesium-protoporphyrin IX monomethyl ester cyclase